MKTIISKVVIFASLFLLYSSFAFSEERPEKLNQILVLHSYHQHYPWTQSQHEGFLSFLNENLEEPYVLSTEHLDTKRVNFDDAYRAFFKDYLEGKYSEYEADLIFVTDDNALHFALSSLPQHLHKAPIVFSGVNNLELINSLNRQRFVGVHENKEIGPNLELLSILNPDIDRLAVLGDGSSTHEAIRVDLNHKLSNLPGLKISFIEETDIDLVTAKLRSMKDKYVLLTTIGGIRSAENRSLTLNEISKNIASVEGRIIISMEDAYIYGGVLGGYATSGLQQGTIAASLARSILLGKDPSELNMIITGTSSYIFDHKQLEKFKIDLPDAIRQQALILNKPPSWYERNRQLITSSLVLLSIISFVLLASFVLMLYRKNKQILQSAKTIAIKERQEMERLHKVEEFKEALVQLSKQNVDEVSDAFDHACRISSETLGVKRVSVWMCSEGRTSIVNASQYVMDIGHAEKGAELKREDFPLYFKAMDSGRLLVIDDVFSDVITSEMTEVYLRPNNITSMLDAPILYQGECMGVVCHEHIGPKRNWTLDEQEFVLAIAKTISLSLEISKRKGIEKILEYHAYHDSLTHLPNRSLLIDRLDQAIVQASRSEKKVAVIFMDLDHFKHINDSLGHTVGDKLLVEVSHILKGIIRESDTISRIGGDEFILVIHPFDSIDQVTDVATTISNALQQPISIDDIELSAYASMGISMYPDDGKEAEVLIKNADAAMYHAKREGRNSFHFFNQDMTERALARVALESSLRNAISDEEFVPYFQAQYDLQKKSLIGFEALARWQHPDKGILTPFHFISVAEETGLIIHIDRLIMRKAISQYKEWLDRGWELGVLSLNLSMRQLDQNDFYREVKELLAALNFKPENLNFEVTESYVMKDPERAVTLLGQLRELGIGLSIDDFGTGYSSLAYLKRLPVNKLKIDKSFVSDVLTDQEDATITKAVIALASSLNLNVIAEGVEEKEQADFLLENGCSEVQGYFYSKPIDAHSLEASIDSLINKLV